jgi:hypothetical protein
MFSKEVNILQVTTGENIREFEFIPKNEATVKSELCDAVGNRCTDVQYLPVPIVQGKKGMENIRLVAHADMKDNPDLVFNPLGSYLSGGMESAEPVCGTVLLANVTWKKDKPVLHRIPDKIATQLKALLRDAPDFAVIQERCCLEETKEKDAGKPAWMLDMEEKLRNQSMESAQVTGHIIR